MDRMQCSKVTLEFFANKQHTVEYKEVAGKKFEFKTYEVQVAVFGDDFSAPPTIETIRIKLTDEEYLLLLQWQLQNPECGYNACDADLYEILGSVDYQVEDKIYDLNPVGTYAIYLSEIKRDAATILANMSKGR